MYTNFEFFDPEPIENIISCLNYKMDKVIFFGYKQHMTEEAREITRIALKDLCHISDVIFVEVSQKKLDRILEIMERYIDEEIAAKNNCYFDLTGGEDMVLLAMGMLKEKRHIPIHQFDIESGEIRVFEEDGKTSIVEAGIEYKIHLDLNDVLKLHGASIAHRNKVISQDVLNSQDFQKDVEILFEISSKDARIWNDTANILKNFSASSEENTVCGSYNRTSKNALDYGKNNINQDQKRRVSKQLRTLEENRIISVLEENDKFTKLKYKNEKVWECIKNPGTILEVHTYYEAKKDSRFSDCRTGVQIDWDGAVVSEQSIRDNEVENEIDVMLLSGYIPYFISCKNGKVDQMALYELDTVSRRFGGKYAQKYLVVGQEICENYKNRAAEMGIEIIEAF